MKANNKTAAIIQNLMKSWQNYERGRQSLGGQLILPVLFFAIKNSKGKKPLLLLVLKWSRLPDSDRRPHPYHGCALPAELRRHLYAVRAFRA